VRTEWLKALGDGLHEFRVRHDAAEIAQAGKLLRQFKERQRRDNLG
jgi:hypothetical protein